MSTNSLLANLEAAKNKSVEPVETLATTQKSDSAIKTQKESETSNSLKTLQKSNIAILQKPIVKSIFDVENDEGTKVITTRLKLSQIRRLKDFCYYLDIKTGRDNKLQDVIAQAINEFFDNHPIENLIKEVK